MVTLAAGKSFLTAAAMTCAAEWRMRPSPSGGVGSNRSQGESLGSSGDRRSQIQKRIAGLAGNRRLEAFSAQSLFQSIRTGRPVGDLNHFSFY